MALPTRPRLLTHNDRPRIMVPFVSQPQLYSVLSSRLSNSGVDSFFLFFSLFSPFSLVLFFLPFSGGVFFFNSSSCPCSLFSSVSLPYTIFLVKATSPTTSGKGAEGHRAYTKDAKKGSGVHDGAGLALHICYVFFFIQGKRCFARPVLIPIVCFCFVLAGGAAAGTD